MPITNPLKLGELIITDAVTKLQANYPSRVATLNAFYNDGITISAPITTGGGALDGSAYYKSGKWPVAENPAVLVVEGTTDFEHDLEGPHGLTNYTRIRVIVVDADQDRERLVKKLGRHANVIIGCLWDDTPAEKLTNAFYIHPIRTFPGPASQEQVTDPWRAFYGIDFIVKQLAI